MFLHLFIYRLNYYELHTRHISHNNKFPYRMLWMNAFMRKDGVQLFFVFFQSMLIVTLPLVTRKGLVALATRRSRCPSLDW